MRKRLGVAVLIAVVAGLFAVAEIVWVIAFIDRSSDGPAFAMALITLVLVPTLLGSIAAVLVDAAPRWIRLAATAAVGLSGLAAAGLEAGVFVGDDPADPAFIQVVAALPGWALVAAVLLTGLAAWRLLRALPLAPRIVLTAITAIVGPVVLAFVLLTGMPIVMLVALAAPVVLGTVAIVTSRKRGRRAVLRPSASTVDR